MSSYVISVSREFGSGGRVIGKQLAAKLGIPCYDRTIIQKTSEKSGLSPDFIARAEERARSRFHLSIAPIGIGAPAFTHQGVPVSHQALFAQAEEQLGGVDILVTHAPARGLGDLDDGCHRGFECFRALLDRYSPAYHCYGHVHLQYVPTQPRTRQYGATTMINASGKYLIELPDREEKPKKWWQRRT